MKFKHNGVMAQEGIVWDQSGALVLVGILLKSPCGDGMCVPRKQAITVRLEIQIQHRDPVAPRGGRPNLRVKS